MNIDCFQVSTYKWNWNKTPPSTEEDDNDVLYITKCHCVSAILVKRTKEELHWYMLCLLNRDFTHLVKQNNLCLKRWNSQRNRKQNHSSKSTMVCANYKHQKVYKNRNLKRPSIILTIAHVIFCSGIIVEGKKIFTSNLIINYYIYNG